MDTSGNTKMSIEQKARAYDEAKERMRAFLKEWENCGAYGEAMEKARSVFPEIVESEDERIRKALIDALKTSKSVGELKFILPEPTREECLAYLERQKEQKVSVDDFKAKDWYVSKVDGKIHNIYYSVDKVKPKFKVGDKIIEKDFDECGRGTIIDIKDGKYIFDDGGFICIEEQGLWKLVEQKPAEWNNATINGEPIPTENHSVDIPLAEWSEEDERIRKDIIQFAKVRIAGGDIEAGASKWKEWIAYLEKQKNLDKMIVVSPEVWDNAISDAYENGKKEGVKQKEPHYTKRNALFDKCVENCDPNTVEEVNKRVDDIMNMPKLSPFEQALTNFIGDWEDDEEHWPSKFVKKHGKYILDIAREELQKEQKPVEWSDYKDKVNVPYCSSEPEWSEEDEEMISKITDVITGYHPTRSTKENEEMIAFLKSLHSQPQGVYKQVIHSIFKMLKDKDFYGIPLSNCVSLLNDIRVKCKDADECAEILDEPSWKPSEKQMKALEDAFRKDGSDEYRRTINSLYQDLKKL